MPVLVGGSETVYTHGSDCAATKLCARNCKDGYTLGEIGRDGCRSCTCVTKAGTYTLT